MASARLYRLAPAPDPILDWSNYSTSVFPRKSSPRKPQIDGTNIHCCAILSYGLNSGCKLDGKHGRYHATWPEIRTDNPGTVRDHLAADGCWVRTRRRACCRLTRHRLGPACNSGTHFSAVGEYTEPAVGVPTKPHSRPSSSRQKASPSGSGAAPPRAVIPSPPAAAATQPTPAMTLAPTPTPTLTPTPEPSPTSTPLPTPTATPQPTPTYTAGADSHADLDSYPNTHRPTSAHTNAATYAYSHTSANTNAATYAYSHTFAHRNAQTAAAQREWVQPRTGGCKLGSGRGVGPHHPHRTGARSANYTAPTLQLLGRLDPDQRYRFQTIGRH